MSTSLELIKTFSVDQYLGMLVLMLGIEGDGIVGTVGG
jgi:hypothetical protein